MATDKAITYLKNKAPKGEFLAYINKKEAAMLKKAGGSGELVEEDKTLLIDPIKHLQKKLTLLKP